MSQSPTAQPERPLKARPRPGRRRRPAVLFTVLLAAALTVAGCGSSSGGDSSSAAAPAKAADGSGSGSTAGSTADGPSGTATGSTPGSTSGTGTDTPAATYLVRTADLSVRTPHVAQQLDKAREYAVQAGGYAGDENTSVDSRGRTSSTIQLRVPPAGYDQLLDQLAALGTLVNRQVTVEDVTGQVVDVDSRIKSQQASVSRVRALMDRATKLSDVVTLESELSTRESALEALEAQQASLKSRTDLATVTLRLTEPAAKPAPPKKATHHGFWTSVGDALANGWHAFYLTVRGLFIAVSVTLPFLLLALLGWFGYRLVRRRLRTRA
jgi:hypothetical protein